MFFLNETAKQVNVVCGKTLLGMARSLGGLFTLSPCDTGFYCILRSSTIWSAWRLQLSLFIKGPIKGRLMQIFVHIQVSIPGTSG
jgi:hypothetical protein